MRSKHVFACDTNCALAKRTILNEALALNDCLKAYISCLMLLHRNLLRIGEVDIDFTYLGI